MADVELKVAVTPYVNRIIKAIRSQDCADPLFQILDDYARANLAQLQAENEPLRAEMEGLRAERMVVIENHAYWKARAEQLEEVVQRVVDDMQEWGAPARGAHIERIIGELKAALAQEDRNG